MAGGTVTGGEIDLERQPLSGTVSDYGERNSYHIYSHRRRRLGIATLTGATAISGLQQLGTELRGIPTISNGSAIHVRGLLFLDTGTHKLVAGRMMAP